jgi:riboflavin synthase
MFTGIITDVGRVVSVADRGDHRFVLATAFDTTGIDLGASIACSGCCLTVVEKETGRFAVDASAETLSVTTLGDWREGTAVNLERALRVGDELGGHIVSGHVDGVGTVVSVRPEGTSRRIDFEAPLALARFIASKGSIAVDGVSLTVNEVDGRRFGTNIIPHTLSHTTFHDLAPGRRVNLEIDMLARYVARLMQPETSR